MNLYEINAAIQAAFDKGYEEAFIDFESGEFDEVGFAEYLTKLELAEEEKLENIVLWVKNLEAEAAAIRAEEKVLADRRQGKERKAERLQRYITDYLTFKGQDKFETAKCKVSFRTVSALCITDTEQLNNWLNTHDEFLRYAAPALDKIGLKKYLKSNNVPGAELGTSKHIQIK